MSVKGTDDAPSMKWRKIYVLKSLPRRCTYCELVSSDVSLNLPQNETENEPDWEFSKKFPRSTYASWSPDVNACPMDGVMDGANVTLPTYRGLVGMSVRGGHSP